MAKTEKIFYILEQVRLCLDRKDFIRCAPWLLAGANHRPSLAEEVRSDSAGALTGPQPDAHESRLMACMQAVLVCIIM